MNNFSKNIFLLILLTIGLHAKSVRLSNTKLSETQHDKKRIYEFTEQTLKENILQNKDCIIVLYFKADWCSYCKKFSPVFSQVAQETHKDIIFGTINVDLETNLRSKYEIKVMPSVCILKNGKSVWKHNGTVSKEKLTEAINKLLN